MLIPCFHVIATEYPIASGQTFIAGYAVSIDSTGKAVPATGGAATNYVYGLCADKVGTAEAYQFQNRISDMGNDTAASGMVTVYNAGGEFYIDVDDDHVFTPMGTEVRGVLEVGATKTPGTPLYASTTAGMLSSSRQGTEIPVAVIVENSGALDSGIPGEFEPGSSYKYEPNDGVTRSWVKIKLLV
jgi:hypothetical protein